MDSDTEHPLPPPTPNSYSPGGQMTTYLLLLSVAVEIPAKIYFINFT